MLFNEKFEELLREAMEMEPYKYYMVVYRDGDRVFESSQWGHHTLLDAMEEACDFCKTHPTVSYAIIKVESRKTVITGRLGVDNEPI